LAEELHFFKTKTAQETLLIFCKTLRNINGIYIK